MNTFVFLFLWCPTCPEVMHKECSSCFLNVKKSHRTKFNTWVHNSKMRFHPMRHLLKDIFMSGIAVHAKEACLSVWRISLSVCSFCILAIWPPFRDSTVHRHCFQASCCFFLVLSPAHAAPCHWRIFLPCYQPHQTYPNPGHLLLLGLSSSFHSPYFQH